MKTDPTSRTLFVQYQISLSYNEMNYSEFTSVSHIDNYNNSNRTMGAANKSEIEYIETFNLFIAE